MLRVNSDGIGAPCRLAALPSLQLENDYMNVSAAGILTGMFFCRAKNDVASLKCPGLTLLAGESELRFGVAHRVNYISGMRMHNCFFPRLYVDVQYPYPIAVQQHLVLVRLYFHGVLRERRTRSNHHQESDEQSTHTYAAYTLHGRSSAPILL